MKLLLQNKMPQFQSRVVRLEGHCLVRKCNVARCVFKRACASKVWRHAPERQLNSQRDHFFDQSGGY